MIFWDMGVNPTPWGYSAYDEIIRKLIARGIPRAQIATIGEAMTRRPRQETPSSCSTRSAAAKFAC